MAHLITHHQQKMFGLSCKEISSEEIKTTTSPLAQKILHLLAKKQNYPKALAKELHVHEQKVYYHIRKLEQAGIIKRTDTKVTIGSVLATYYQLTAPAVALSFKQPQELNKIPLPEESETSLLSTFITHGELDATLVMGSPATHSPLRTRSRDHRLAVELAFFLGTRLTNPPALTSFKLDTEITKEDTQGNLILLGGPSVNTLTKKYNKHFPIRFTEKGIYSSTSKKKYSHDETGVITKITNPSNREKKILLLAGNTYLGTQACVFALCNSLRKLKNITNKYIIEGVDENSDGLIDDIQIHE